MSSQLRRSNTKTPSLNISRFTPANRARKLKRKSVLNSKKLDKVQSADDEGEGIIDKNSKEYLEGLINTLFVKLHKEGDKLDEYLPLLTSSSEIDLQLHAIIGLLLKNFVSSWYDRITDDYSTEFLVEIIFTVAHITRSIEGNLRKINYKEFLLDDLFIVIDFHLCNWRKLTLLIDNALIGVPIPHTSETEQLVELFQVLEPHVGITNELLYLKTLSTFLLQQVLPQDNVNSKLTTTMLENVLTNLVLQNVVSKLSETYLCWELIGKICDSIVNEDPEPVKTTTVDRNMSGIIRYLGHSVAYMTSTLTQPTAKSQNSLRPILSFHIFTFLNNFFNFAYNFPIISMILTICNKLLFANTKLNQILRNVINNLLFKFLLNEQFVVKVLSISRSTIFPEDDQFYLEPRFIPTTDEELEILMTDTRTKILAVFDKFKLLKFLMYHNNDNLLSHDVTFFLQSFKYNDINKHLVLMFLDLIFARLFPEIN